MRTGASAVVVAAALGLGYTVLPGRAQEPVATFRADINVVEVDARVLDGQGRFVRDLTAADFELYEDGKLQPLTSVDLVDVPRMAPPRQSGATPAPSDVSSNALEAMPGRYFIIALDDLQTS